MPVDVGSARDTVVQPLYSAAAAPFGPSEKGHMGVLACERVQEERLDRIELAKLAVLGHRIAHALCMGDANPNDTRFGCELTPTPMAS